MEWSIDMAAGYLSVPGSEWGPCTEACGHTDCAATRRMAATICHHCNEEIGYVLGFFDIGRDDERRGVVLAHSRCVLVMEEK